MISISRQEEIISALWTIAAVSAFGFGYQMWGWIFAVKAASDFVCAIYAGTKESLSERKAA